jgi:transposase
MHHDSISVNLATYGPRKLKKLHFSELERLPAYAPELNPVEYLWGYWKHHELPNFCPKNFAELSDHARHALRRMRARPALVRSFWQQAQLL